MRRLICAFVDTNHQRQFFSVAYVILPWTLRKQDAKFDFREIWYNSDRIVICAVSSKHLQCVFRHTKSYTVSDRFLYHTTSQYVNWNKHPVPVPPSSRLIHDELQHSCVTSCQKSCCESCWHSCNCEGPPIKIHFSIDLSNCYSYNHVIMYTCDCQFHLNHANWHLSSFSTQNGSDCEQVVF